MRQPGAPWPVMERPLPVLALAVAAGTMSGYTFFVAQIFSTVQSGNMIQFGYWLALGDFGRWVPAALAILAFGLGSAATAVVENAAARRQWDHSAPILVFEAAVLGLLGFSAVHDRFDPIAVCYAISFLAGMQGNAFHRMEGMLYGNVAVTMVVQMAFNYLTQSLFRAPWSNLSNSGLYFMVLVGFAAGGFVAAALASAVGERTLWLTAALLLATAVAGLAARTDGVAIDASA